MLFKDSKNKVYGFDSEEVYYENKIFYDEELIPLTEEEIKYFKEHKTLNPIPIEQVKNTLMSELKGKYESIYKEIYLNISDSLKIKSVKLEYLAKEIRAKLAKDTDDYSLFMDYEDYGYETKEDYVNDILKKAEEYHNLDDKALIVLGNRRVKIKRLIETSKIDEAKELLNEFTFDSIKDLVFG